jgi:hypothetical protein
MGDGIIPEAQEKVLLLSESGFESMGRGSSTVAHRPD